MGPIGANPSHVARRASSAILSGLLQRSSRSSTATSPTPMPSSTATRSTHTPPTRQRRPPRRRPTSLSSPSRGPRDSPGTTWAMRYPPCPPGPCAGYQWAPSVWARPDGTFVMYYATPATHPLDCVYKATAPGCVQTTHGPNTVDVHLPGHQHQPGGARSWTTPAPPSSAPRHRAASIDPSIFVASNGTPWLLWKSRRRLLQPADVHLLPAALTRRPLDRRSARTSSSAPPSPGRAASSRHPRWSNPATHSGCSIRPTCGERPNYSIGIAEPASRSRVRAPSRSTGPGTRARTAPTDRATAGRSSSSAGGGLVWMVHHGLVPGQSGRLRRTAPLRRPDGVPGQGTPGGRAQAAGRGAGRGRRSTTKTPTSPHSPSAAYLHHGLDRPRNLHRA